MSMLKISLLLLMTNVSRSFVVTNKAATWNVLKSTESSTGTEVSIKEEPKDFREPEDAIINIQNRAMKHLRFLKEQQKADTLILRMGVRNGGCSGLSYVMDYTTEDNINYDDDIVDVYQDDNIKCVIDSKSMLYLYGLRLDYSDDLIGGGFKFFNPNAESSCGCGSSFGV